MKQKKKLKHLKTDYFGTTPLQFSSFHFLSNKTMSATVIKPTTTTRTIPTSHLARPNSPEQLQENEFCPELTASVSNDTRASSIDSYNSKSIPIKKSTRFGALFSSTSSRSGSKVIQDTEGSPASHDTLPTNVIPAIDTNLRRRSSSGAQSYRSVENSDNPSSSASPRHQHKFSKSIGNLISSPASWTRKHLHHHHHHHHSASEPCSPSTNVPKLNEKYGEYIKPSKKASTKGIRCDE